MPEKKNPHTPGDEVFFSLPVYLFTFSAPWFVYPDEHGDYTARMRRDDVDN